MEPAPPSSILVVDDHPLVRLGVRSLLEAAFAGTELLEADTAADALAIARSCAPALVILDLTLPDRDGLGTLTDLRACSSAPVVVYSAHAEEPYAIRAIRAGAAGYVPKTSAGVELVRAVRSVLAGGCYVSASLAQRLVEHASHDRDRPGHPPLSRRELEVLRLLAAGRTVKEIGIQLSLSDKTVSTYRARTLDKLRLRTNAELRRYALRLGLWNER